LDELVREAADAYSQQFYPDVPVVRPEHPMFGPPKTLYPGGAPELPRSISKAAAELERAASDLRAETERRRQPTAGTHSE
jgi:hypothetical protein